MPQPHARPHRALVAFALIATIAFNLFCVLQEKSPTERVFAFTFATATTLLIVCLTQRFWFSLLASVAVYSMVWIASSLKFKYLEVPLIAPDLYYFINADTVKVLSNYPALGFTSLAVLVLVPLVVLWIWRRDHPHAFHRLEPRPRVVARVAGALFALTAMGLMAWPLGPYGAVHGKTLWQAIISHSYITDFITSFNDTRIRIPAPRPDPPGAPVDWHAPLAMPAPAATDAVPESPPAVPQRLPDVIAVLEESTFDPAMLAVCEGEPRCRFHMFEPDSRTRASGRLAVHTFGGGTWLSEFTVVTGLAHTLFGNAGAFAPYNLAPRVQYTLAHRYKAAGYRVVALYPTAADFINGRNAYRDYGFDYLYDGAENGIEWGDPDQKIFDVFWKVYEQEKTAHPEKPLFLFMMTIHQHGPHMKPLEDLAPPYDKPVFGNKVSDWLNLNLNNYLERAAESDAALKRLEARLLDRPEPTVLMHFGDHQPAFDGAIYNLEFRLPKDWGEHREWATYYMIRSNFEPTRKYHFPILDIVYLGGLTADIAGVPPDRYYTANTLLRDRCHGRYLECSDPVLVPSYHNYVFHELKALGE